MVERWFHQGNLPSKLSTNEDLRRNMLKSVPWDWATRGVDDRQLLQLARVFLFLIGSAHVRLESNE
jgi:hypothetical protein